MRLVRGAGSPRATPSTLMSPNQPALSPSTTKPISMESASVRHVDFDACASPLRRAIGGLMAVITSKPAARRAALRCRDVDKQPRAGPEALRLHPRGGA